MHWSHIKNKRKLHKTQNLLLYRWIWLDVGVFCNVRNCGYLPLVFGCTLRINALMRIRNIYIMQLRCYGGLEPTIVGVIDWECSVLGDVHRYMLKCVLPFKCIYGWNMFLLFECSAQMVHECIWVKCIKRPLLCILLCVLGFRLSGGFVMYICRYTFDL